MTMDAEIAAVLDAGGELPVLVSYHPEERLLVATSPALSGLRVVAHEYPYLRNGIMATIQTLVGASASGVVVRALTEPDEGVDGLYRLELADPEPAPA